MSEPEECLRLHSEAEFAVMEHFSEVVFLNPDVREVHQYQVDRCIFGDEDGKRCDWLINVHGNNLSVLVELKGSDIDGAFEQLAETQRILVAIMRRDIVWIISYSGSPRFNSTIQLLILRARREYKAKLRVEGSPYRHKL